MALSTLRANITSGLTPRDPPQKRHSSSVSVCVCVSSLAPASPTDSPSVCWEICKRDVISRARKRTRVTAVLVVTHFVGDVNAKCARERRLFLTCVNRWRAQRCTPKIRTMRRACIIISRVCPPIEPIKYGHCGRRTRTHSDPVGIPPFDHIYYTNCGCGYCVRAVEQKKQTCCYKVVRASSIFNESCYHQVCMLYT